MSKKKRNDERLQVAVILALENKAQRNKAMTGHPASNGAPLQCVAEVVDEVKAIAQKWAEGKKP